MQHQMTICLTSGESILGHITSWLMEPWGKHVQKGAITWNDKESESGERPVPHFSNNSLPQG